MTRKQNSSIYSTLSRLLSWWPAPRPGSGAASGTHIAYIIWKFPTSSETFIRREIEALTARGKKVSVISEYRPENETDEAALSGWMESTLYMKPLDRAALTGSFQTVLRRRPLRTLNLLLYTIGHRYHLNKRFDYDWQVFLYTCHVAETARSLGVTHIHSPWANLQAFIASGVAALLGIPYSLHARAHDIHRFSYRYGFREKFDRARFIVTNSRYNRNYLGPRVSPAAAERIHVIYNGVPVHRYSPDPQDGGRDNGSGPVRFTCVARLIEEKGLVHLLQACDLLKTRDVSFRLDIAGGPDRVRDNDYHVRLDGVHRELRLDSHVRFLGALPQERVKEQLRGSEVFVLPCVPARDGGNDITPNALLEAMATALPVVSTTITAIPEIVDDGIQGLLVPPGDDVALADAMQKLAESATMRRDFGRAARARILDRFDINKNIEAYTALFEA